VVAVNATCRADEESAPLTALTRQLLLGYTDRKQLAQEAVPFIGREALRTRVDARLDGVPLALELWVARRDGCVFDLSYVAPPARFGDGSAEFTRFVAGFSDESGTMRSAR
jgi:hypothetical protein